MPKVKSKHGNPERGRSALEDELTRMSEIAYRLCCRATNSGVSAAFILAAHDPLSGENFHSEGFAGNSYAISGAARVVLKRWEKS